MTAQKREQLIQDVPLSITAYNSKDLEILGVEQFDDLANFVPGLEVQEQSSNNPGFVIRGITSDSGEATIEPRISIYQDGVSISRSRGSFVEILDSSVEVIRGPQPTLFGRSALIGAVNVNSNSPLLDEMSATVKAGYGNLNSRQLDAVANLPILEKKAAIRAALRYKKRGGYVENLLGEKLNGYETLAGRLSLALEPKDKLDISLIASFQTDDNTGTSFKSGTFFPSLDGSIAPSSPAALSNFGGLHEGKDLGLERNIYSLTSKIDYLINTNLSISSITNYREFDSFEVFDPDGFHYNLFSFAENAQSQQFSQELRLNFSVDDKVTGFFGTSYFDEDGFQNTPLGIGENIAQALLAGFLFTDAPGVPQNPFPLANIPNINLNPNSSLFGSPLGIHLEEATNFNDSQSWDLFADFTFALTDKLEITAGTRYTNDNKTSGFSVGAETPSQLTGVGLLLGTGIVSNNRKVEAEDNFDGLTWRLAANYKVDDSLTIFGNYARGRRPEVLAYNFDANDVSVLQTGRLPNHFETLEAEIVNAYEIGVNSLLWEGRLNTDLSAYIYQYSNFQSTVIDSDTGQSRPINAGNASAIGIEMLSRLAVNDNLELFGVYALTEATFDETDDSGNQQEFAGNRFRLTPKHALTIGAKLHQNFSFGDLTFIPVFNWKSKVFFNNDNDQYDLTPDEFQPAYGLFDMKLIYSPNNKRWSGEIFAKNVTDKNYLLDAGNVGGIFGIPTFIAAPPRTYGASITFNF